MHVFRRMRRGLLLCVQGRPGLDRALQYPGIRPPGRLGSCLSQFSHARRQSDIVEHVKPCRMTLYCNLDFSEC